MLREISSAYIIGEISREIGSRGVRTSLIDELETLDRARGSRSGSISHSDLPLSMAKVGNAAMLRSVDAVLRELERLRIHLFHSVLGALEDRTGTTRLCSS